VAFAEGVQKFPKSSKGPDTLLKLGMSLAQLNQVRDACATLGLLGSQYPEAAGAIKSRAQQERTRLKCS